MEEALLSLLLSLPAAAFGFFLTSSSALRLGGRPRAGERQLPLRRSALAARLRGLAPQDGHTVPRACAAARADPQRPHASPRDLTRRALPLQVLQLHAARASLPFQRPHWERCVSLQRLEPGVCFDEHVSLPKLRRLWLDPASPGAAVGAPLVHVVREPLDVCISAYLCVARLGSTARLPSLMSPIPAAATTCTRAKRGCGSLERISRASRYSKHCGRRTRAPGYSLSVAARSAIRSHSKRKCTCTRVAMRAHRPIEISLGCLHP